MYTYTHRVQCRCVHVYMYIHVHVHTVIETRQSKATTPDDNSFFLKRAT